MIAKRMPIFGERSFRSNEEKLMFECLSLFCALMCLPDEGHEVLFDENKPILQFLSQPPDFPIHIFIYSF